MESPDSPATKADLEAALNSHAAALNSHLEAALNSHTAALNSQLTAALSTAVDEIKSYVREQVFDMETKLLRAFADYNGATTIRFRKLEADVSNIDAAGTQRLALVETKLTDLEIRMIKLEAKA